MSSRCGCGLHRPEAFRDTLPRLREKKGPCQLAGPFLLGPINTVPGDRVARLGAGWKAPARSKVGTLQARATQQTAPKPGNPKGRPLPARHSSLHSLRVQRHTRRRAPRLAHRQGPSRPRKQCSQALVVSFLRGAAHLQRAAWQASRWNPAFRASLLPPRVAMRCSLRKILCQSIGAVAGSSNWISAGARAGLCT